MKVNVLATKAAVAAFVLFELCPAYATAAEPTEVEQLKDRVSYLESRLAEVEALLRANAPKHVAGKTPTNKAAAAPTKPAQSVPVAAAAASPVPAAPPPAPAPAGTATAQPGAASATTASAAPATAPGTTSGAAQPADDAPQELNVLRQNSVTLKPAGVEVSTEFDYETRRTQLQQDRGYLTNTNVRYGVLDWLELSATIPAGYTTRSTNVSLGTTLNRSVSGLGDILLQANARLVEQTRNWPGVVASLGVYLPTGTSPYNFSGYKLDQPNTSPTPNPSDVLSYYYSERDWGLRGNLQFYKTVDPLILFFGVGTNAYLPERIDGYSVSTGVSVNYNLGFSFAASEKTTLGFTVSGAYLPGITVNNRTVLNSSSEPLTARLTLIQRLAKGVYIEPSAIFGLNQDAPDVGLGLGLRARF